MDGLGRNWVYGACCSARAYYPIIYTVSRRYYFLSFLEQTKRYKWNCCPSFCQNNAHPLINLENAFYKVCAMWPQPFLFDLGFKQFGCLACPHGGTFNNPRCPLQHPQFFCTTVDKLWSHEDNNSHINWGQPINEVLKRQLHVWNDLQLILLELCSNYPISAIFTDTNF